MKNIVSDDEMFSKQEIEQRFRKALTAAVNMPPKPHTAKKRRPAKASPHKRKVSPSAAES